MKKETKSTLFAGLAMTAISGVLNPVIQASAKAVLDHMTHDIEVSDWVYTLDKGLGAYFKDVEDAFYLDNNNRVKFKKNISGFSRTQQDYTSTIFYGGYPITIKSTQTDKDSAQINIRLITINTKRAIENLKRFIKECYIITHKGNIKSVSKDVSVYATSRRGDTARYYLNPFKKRTFENTFIPEEHEKIIKDSLNNFINRREWYKNNNIPYHFGFLLYGEPGHGKSVLAQAIADYIDAELIVFPGDAINELPQHIGNDIQRNSIDETAYRVICIEDVDCGFAESKMSKIWNDDDGTTKNVERKVGLAEILNCLDGLNAPQNTIYVLTTNHIDKLDPALIRPGRCDVKLEVPGVTRETFIKFINYHYKCGAAKDSFQNMNFDTGITFAELQTLVMEGASIKDLCEIIENKGENK